MHTFSHRERERRGELNQRDEEKGNSSQSCVENITKTDCTVSPVYKL
jgi:hypothetical protein